MAAKVDKPELEEKKTIVKHMVVKISSLSPVIFNRMSEEVLIAMYEGKKLVKKDLPMMTHCEAQLYREFGDSGAIGLPAENFFACFVNAGRRVMLDTRAKISTSDSTVLPALMSIDASFIPFTITTPAEELDKIPDSRKSAEGWVIDMRKGNLCNKGEKTAIPLVRPKIHAWTAEIPITLTLGNTAVTEATINELISIAGNMVGVGSYRPSCKGPFGRFKVVEMKEVPVEVAEAA